MTIWVSNRAEAMLMLTRLWHLLPEEMSKAGVTQEDQDFIEKMDETWQTPECTLEDWCRLKKVYRQVFGKYA